MEEYLLKVEAFLADVRDVVYSASPKPAVRLPNGDRPADEPTNRFLAEAKKTTVDLIGKIRGLLQDRAALQEALEQERALNLQLRVDLKSAHDGKTNQEISMDSVQSMLGVRVENEPASAPVLEPA